MVSPESIALIFPHTRNSQLAVSQIRGATTPVPQSPKPFISLMSQHTVNREVTNTFQSNTDHKIWSSCEP
ncbi:unnamed protein product [Boreogadus saida]